MKFKMKGHRPLAWVRNLSNTQRRAVRGLIWGLAITLGWGAEIPARAAERITIQLGPFAQEIAIADLEQFAKTGKASGKLQLYAPLLTSQVRELLNQRLQLDPKMADQLIAEVLRSPTSKQLIATLGVAIPNSSVTEIQAAVSIAARQFNGLSVVSFLRAYPGENITIDASSAIALALEFNPAYWQSQALEPLLERELASNNRTTFKSNLNPAASGAQIIQQQTLFFQDQKRDRTIPVDIYFPKPFSSTDVAMLRLTTRQYRRSTATPPSLATHSPLIIISHGLGADRKFLAYLARHLATHGFTIAAIEHPSGNVKRLFSASTVNNPNELLPAKEFIERPKDISFVIDELAKLNQQSGSLLGKLNTEKVTVIGHSLGGYTALAVAGAELNLQELRQLCKNSSPIGQAVADWLQCAAADLPNRQLQLRDQRVAGVIALNPLVGNLFGKNGLNKVVAPVLILGGTEDAVTPIVNHQLRPFTQLGGTKYLLTAIGGTHLSIGARAGITTNNTIVKERRGAETESLRQLVQGVSVAFIKQLTPEAKIYAPFLTSAYAESLSKPELSLRLSSELPASITPLVEFVVKP